MAEVAEEEAQPVAVAAPAGDGDPNLDPNNVLNEDVMVLVSSFLSYNDFKNCRRVCRQLNDLAVSSAKFQRSYKGKLMESWYKDAVNFNLTKTLRWYQLRLNHLTFHRHSALFKNYWHQAVSNTLSKLTLHRCSFECDAFIFLLSHCAVLETLVIHTSKLRDLDDFHTVPGRERLGAACDFQPAPIAKPLQHLVIESVFKFEQCFFDYLHQRTSGQLRSLTVCRCFHAYDPQLTDKCRPSIEMMYDEFERNILRLLFLSKQTLVKFCYQENNFQMKFFRALTTNHDLLQVSDLVLALTAAEPTVGYQPFIEYMIIPKPFVDSLSLQFGGFIANETFAVALESFRPTLRNLTVYFVGNTMNMAQKFDISSINAFQQLDSFTIRDKKSISPRDVRLIMGGRRTLARLGYQENLRAQEQRPYIARRVNDAIVRLESNLSTSFLGQLPNTLTKFSIEQCMFGETNFMFGLPSMIQQGPLNPQLICALTKVQIRGPWIHSLRGIIGGLVAKLPNVESLALTYCCLDDAELTGLDEVTTLDMRRSLTHGLALLSNRVGEPPRLITAADIIQAVEEAMVVERVPEYNTRPRLFMLRRLKHLDLTGNTSVSDVTLFDSLRNPGLKTISLMSCNRITDTGLQYLKIFCPNLEDVNVKNCRRISKHGLNSLVVACKKLRRVITTDIIREREIPAFVYTISPNYNEVVIAPKGPDPEGFLEVELEA